MSEVIHTSEKFGEINLSSMAGVQTALAFLGHNAGEVDGFDGPNTRAALRSFQTAAGIAADGFIGPNSRKALLAALDAAAKSDDASS